MAQMRFMASVVAVSLFLAATAFAETDKKTERLWKSKCASCHGQGGKGDTDKGQQLKITDMTTAAFQAKKDDELKNDILNGPKGDKAGPEHSFKNDLTPEQVDALVAYIRTFKK